MTASLSIGIDPGTKTGWAVLTPDGAALCSGTWLLASRKGDGAGMRFVRFERLFRELLDAYPGAPVAYELVARHIGTDAAHVYGGLTAHIMRICEESSRPYAGIPVGTIKRNATGKGNASKDAMCQAAITRWQLPAVEEDQADALWVADALREGLA